MNVIEFDVAALATGYATFVLAYSAVAEPIRKTVRMLADVDNIKHVSHFFVGRSVLRRRCNIIFSYVEKMLRCPYCTGFWVCVACQLVCQFDMFRMGWRGIFLTLLAMASVTGSIAIALNVLSVYVHKMNKGSV
jgi:hypothetical protein